MDAHPNFTEILRDGDRITATLDQQLASMVDKFSRSPEAIYELAELGCELSKGTPLSELDEEVIRILASHKLFEVTQSAIRRMDERRATK